MIEIFTCPRDVLLFIFQEDACITIIINNLIRLLGYSLTESGYLYASNLYSISMLLYASSRGYHIQSLRHLSPWPHVYYTSSGDSSLSIPNKLSISFSAIFSSCATWPVTSVYA